MKKGINIDLKSTRCRVNQETFLIWWLTRLRGRSYEWHLTCVHGDQMLAKRRRVLELITQLGFSLQLPWLAVGDWNLFASSAEKDGLRTVTLSQTRSFKQFKMIVAFLIWASKELLSHGVMSDLGKQMFAEGPANAECDLSTWPITIINSSLCRVLVLARLPKERDSRREELGQIITLIKLGEKVRYDSPSFNGRRIEKWLIYREASSYLSISVWCRVGFFFLHPGNASTIVIKTISYLTYRRKLKRFFFLLGKLKSVQDNLIIL